MIEVKLWSYLAALGVVLLISIMCIAQFGNVKKRICKNISDPVDMVATIGQE
jgi:hypothetical protein